MKKSLLFLLGLLCISFSTDIQKKVIRYNGFDIECYVCPDKLKNFSDNKMYYWFKSGEIHQSLSSVGGFVLHKSYNKYYKSNALAEQGAFSYGLKSGAWRTWYKNGNLKALQEWKLGYKEGNFRTYDSLGNILTKGVYKTNIKNGYWIDYKKRDTTYHKNNEAFNERPKNLVERLLRKRDSLEKRKIKADRITKRKKDSIKRVKVKTDRVLKKRQDSITKVQKKRDKKTQKKLDSINKAKNPSKGFFKRIFNN